MSHMPSVANSIGGGDPMKDHDTCRCAALTIVLADGSFSALNKSCIIVRMSRLCADFNGLFRGGSILCLSHKDTCLDESGNEVVLHAGMNVTVFDLDEENGKPDNLIASGTVEPSPEWLQCRGSKWILKIDENGVRHESEL